MSLQDSGLQVIRSIFSISPLGQHAFRSASDAWLATPLVLRMACVNFRPLVDNGNLFPRTMSSQTLPTLRLLPKQLRNVRIFLHFIFLSVFPLLSRPMLRPNMASRSRSTACGIELRNPGRGALSLPVCNMIATKFRLHDARLRAVKVTSLACSTASSNNGLNIGRNWTGQPSMINCLSVPFGSRNPKGITCKRR